MSITEVLPNAAAAVPRKNPLAHIFSVLEYLLLAAVIALAVPTVIIPLATDGDRWTVISGSMEPVLKVGTLTVTHPVVAEDIREGDILTYRHPDIKEPITHRVIAIHGTELLMKGDANQYPDAPIQASQVIGKMSYQVPVIGTFAQFVEQNRGLMLAAYFGMAMVFAIGFFRRKVLGTKPEAGA